MEDYKCHREQAIEVAFEDFKAIVDWYAKGCGEKDWNNSAKILLSEFAERILDGDYDGLVD